MSFKAYLWKKKKTLKHQNSIWQKKEVNLWLSADVDVVGSILHTSFDHRLTIESVLCTKTET